MYAREKIFPVNREHMGRTYSTRGSGASIFLEQRHFTKTLVGAHSSQSQFSSLALDENFDLAFLDNEHAFARITLSKDDLAILVPFPQIGHGVAPAQFPSSLEFGHGDTRRSIRACT